MDHIEAQARAARRIAEIRELKTAASETALPELSRMLTPATPDAVLNEVLMVIRSFGSKASELFPAVKNLAEGHADFGVRTLAKSTAKAIRRSQPRRYPDTPGRA